MDIDWLLTSGGAMFGVIIGYLAWYAVMPGIKVITLNTISAFIAVVAGAAITTLFPRGTQLFAGYSFGLAIGFFSPVIKRNRERNKKNADARREALKYKQERKLSQEIQEIKEKWTEIESAMINVVSNYPLPDHGLAEKDIPFSYSDKARSFIMKKFAQNSEDWGMFAGKLIKIPNYHKRKQTKKKTPESYQSSSSQKDGLMFQGIDGLIDASFIEDQVVRALNNSNIMKNTSVRLHKPGGKVPFLRGKGNTRSNTSSAIEVDKVTIDIEARRIGYSSDQARKFYIKKLLDNLAEQHGMLFSCHISFKD